MLNRLAIPVSEDVPLPMESHGIGYGYMVYRTELHRDYTDAKLSFESIGDRAQIYVNDTFAGTVYVNRPPYEVTFSAKSGDCLTVIVENMGRTNFGPKMMRKKGIVGRCLLDGKIHFGWQAWPLTMENLDALSFDAAELMKQATPGGGETFYRFAFDCDHPADTFLRTDGFRKGFAVLNGFNLGRYWEIGPQRTLYVPACVLHPGENELILFESDGLRGAPVITFTDQPDLG